jgi:hypothetical protein
MEQLRRQAELLAKSSYGQYLFRLAAGEINGK